MKRAVMIVLDSLGVGEMPDAYMFGDEGVNTLGHIVEEVPNIQIKNLQSFGIGNIDDVEPLVGYTENVIADFGRARELSNGKDTITGHWEIAGIITQEPFLTFHEGFPEEFIRKFEEEIGTEVLGNYAASGTEIIKVLGPEHIATGKPIVYTSADSVFQIAAHEEVIPPEKLYEICRIARRLLVGDWQVGRVIARPFVGKDGDYTRTANRRDFAVSPPSETLLDNIKNAGQTVWAVGKIEDIFNKCGITDAVHTESNLDGIDRTIGLLKEEFPGLIFTNLVDFDAKFGHRRDAAGYAKAIEEFDEKLPEIIENLKEEDMLILCADHGNDPSYKGFDHTREFVPVMVYGKKLKQGVNLGTLSTFADIGATIGDYLGVSYTGAGKSFLKKITL
ncbi:MAG: phosphopentomutase [Bacillota bacterium]|nr:phosphopentomutase [Bacillota bacterium]